jgi:hypothetical protein
MSFCALRIASVALLLTLAPVDAGSQAFSTLKGKEPIPRERQFSKDPYKSWSLFLLTNQDWLTPGKSKQISELYEQALAFGRVIGRNHLAVWFWKKDMLAWAGVPRDGLIGLSGWRSPNVVENVDVERAIAFCEKLGLKPSRGPYLLFTTTYPEEDVALTNYSVIELGKDPEEVSRMLRRLGDQLVVEGVIRDGSFASSAGSDDFWSAWFTATRHALAALDLGFRVAVRTPTLSLEAGDRQ